MRVPAPLHSTYKASFNGHIAFLILNKYAYFLLPVSCSKGIPNSFGAIDTNVLTKLEDPFSEYDIVKYGFTINMLSDNTKQQV